MLRFLHLVIETAWAFAFVWFDERERLDRPTHQLDRL